MDLIPWEAMEGVARVLDHGRSKYSAHNWRGGFDWGRLAGACLRHVFAWLSGQDLDPESGLSHIDHALCCLMFLTAHIKSGLGKDDRHKAPKPDPRRRFVLEWLDPFQALETWRRDDTGIHYDTREQAEDDAPKSIARGACRVVEIDRA